MCGIVGFINRKGGNSFSQSKRRFMRFALSIDTIRGEDSTGLFTINNKGKVNVKRSLMPGDKWVQGQTFKNLNLDVCAAVGHNRAATKGSVNLENAHPFTFGDVTLVHNGTLSDAGRSLETYDKNLEVDSMQIALALSRQPPKDAVKVLSQIYGSFALVWYDRRDKTINFTRNGGRPLHFCWNNSRDILWFMSDGQHLEAVNKSLRGINGDGGSVYSVQSHTHIKFTMGGELKPKICEFKEYVAPYSTNRGPSKSSYRDYNNRLDNAASTWNDKVKEYKRGLNGGTEVRVEIAGKKRTVPFPQKRALKEMYDVDIDNILEFKQLEFIDTKTKNKRLIVLGEIYHVEWGNSPWPAVIYDVPVVQAKAYQNYTWSVNPVGLVLPIDPENHDVPHMLCSLINTDFKKHFGPGTETKQEEDPTVDLMVPGPEGTMFRRSHIKEMQEDGCIQCGFSVEDDEITQCLLVNDGRDLMCPGCQRELDNSWQEHMNRQAKNLH